MMNPYDPTDPLGTWYHVPLPEKMTDEERDEYIRMHCRAALGTVLSFFLAIIVLGVITALSSCTTTKYVQVPVTHTDTVRMVTLLRDSIYRHDSIIVNQYTKGDTVYQNVDRWHTRYQDRTLRDTAYFSRRDTIGVPYPVECEVAKPLSRWQSFQIWTGRVVLVALAVALAVWIIRKRTWWVGLIRKLLK